MSKSESETVGVRLTKDEIEALDRAASANAGVPVKRGTLAAHIIREWLRTHAPKPADRKKR